MQKILYSEKKVHIIQNMEKPITYQNMQKSRYNISVGSVSRQNQGNKKKLSINERFVLKSMMPIGNFYKTYKGIDLVSRKYVTIYIKPSSKEKLFSKNIKEELRQKIAPPLKWSGTQKIDKNLFDIEVHSRYGPSLGQIMIKYRPKISQKTFYLLAYHLLKLIDRIDNAGYVNRSLSIKNVIVSQICQKNDLYLINSFDLERKNEQSFSNFDIKYCSIGSHLKLKTSSKDTLESMCYLLMDFYLKGDLFSNIVQERQKDYLQAKNILRPEGIPILFLQFYEYVKNLNYSQQIKFTQWKIKFKKALAQDQFSKPYQWVDKKSSKIGNSSLGSKKGEETSCATQGFGNCGFLQNLLKHNSNPPQNQKFQQNSDKEQQEQEKQELFDYQDDRIQIQEGVTLTYNNLAKKVLETNIFFTNKY